MMDLFLPSYGCVKCQTRHFKGIGQSYQAHLSQQSKHGISREQFNKADGWERITEGKLQKGDRVWNKAANDFETIKTDGNVQIEQCHFVIRKINPQGV